ncbi:MAG TPA: glycosyltransferase family 39 protein [Candidatus Hydrogenedentes bacterium]|nr:glycosyltransferase family 39 protein [Candidatus Hydrogenedentota bacterium]
MSPLYYVVQYFWARIFGTSSYSLRMLSLVLGCSTVLLVYLIGFRCGGLWAGTVAGLCLAFSQSHIYYSQEIRCYALIAFLAALSTYGLIQASGNSRRIWWIINGVCNMLLIWTHMFAGALVAGQFVFLLLQANYTKNWRRLLKWTAAQGVNGIFWYFLWYKTIDFSALDFCSSWRYHVDHSLTVFLRDYARFTGFMPLSSADHKFSFVGTPILGLSPAGVFGLFFGLLVLFAMFRVGLQWWRERQGSSEASRQSSVQVQACAILLVLLLAPSCLVFAYSVLISPCYLSRYGMHAGLAWAVFAGFSISLFPWRFLRLLGVCLLVFLFAHQWYFTCPAEWRSDYKSVLACLRQEMKPGTSILVSPNFDRECLLANDDAFQRSQVLDGPEWRDIRMLDFGVLPENIQWILINPESPVTKRYLENKLDKEGVCFTRRTFGVYGTQLHLYQVYRTEKTSTMPGN